MEVSCRLTALNSIIAIMLGRLPMAVNKWIPAYQDMAQRHSCASRRRSPCSNSDMEWRLCSYWDLAGTLYVDLTASTTRNRPLHAKNAWHVRGNVSTAMEGRETELMHDHPSAILSANNLRNALFHQEQYKEGGPMHRQTADRLETALWPNHSKHPWILFSNE